MQVIKIKKTIIFRSPRTIQTNFFTIHFSIPQNVQLDVVTLLKQVLQWAPLYKPSLNLALLQAAKIGSVGCVKVLFIIIG